MCVLVDVESKRPAQMDKRGLGVCVCVCVCASLIVSRKYMNINKGQAILVGNVFVTASGRRHEGEVMKSK